MKTWAVTKVHFFISVGHFSHILFRVLDMHAYWCTFAYHLMFKHDLELCTIGYSFHNASIRSTSLVLDGTLFQAVFMEFPLVPWLINVVDSFCDALITMSVHCCCSGKHVTMNWTDKGNCLLQMMSHIVSLTQSIVLIFYPQIFKKKLDSLLVAVRQSAVI